MTWLLLVSLIAVAGSASLDTDRVLVDLARDIEDRYHLFCMTILYSGDGGERGVRLARMTMMSHEHGIVSVNAIRTFLSHLTGGGSTKATGRCVRALYLILADDEAGTREDVVQLSQTIDVSGTVWLVQLNEKIDVAEFFADVNAAYNMDLLSAVVRPDGSVHLFDVYRVSMSHPVRVGEYGTWSEAYGLKTTASLSFYSRRTNLEGIELNVALKHSPPNHHVVPDHKGRGLMLRGIFGSLWRNMGKRLNFTSHYRVANESGALVRGEWTGTIGMMLRERMDVGVGEITMSPERCAVIHCLRPVIATRNQLYFKKTRLRLQWDAILKPFHMETWLTIILWFLSSSACLNLCFRISRNYSLERRETNFNFLNSVSTIYSAFCQQGSSTSPDSLSCRIIFFMSYIVAGIIFTVYSASLTSFITAQQPFRPFENLEQLLQDGTYTLQPVRNSAAYVSFANATNAFAKEIYRKLIAVIPMDALPSTKMEGLERLCTHDKVVYFGSEFESKAAVGEINKRGHCEIISLEKPLNLVYITMVLSKSSPFKEVFNYHLDAIKYNGYLGRLIKKAWADMNVVQEQQFAGVGMSQVFQMYVILFLGLATSFLLFVIELAMFDIVQRRRLTKKMV